MSDRSTTFSRQKSPPAPAGSRLPAVRPRFPHVLGGRSPTAGRLPGWARRRPPARSPPQPG